MQTLLLDLRYGARMLVKNPSFTLIAVLTLSLGIGANTAIFSVIYGVLLKPLPYPDPDRIVRIWQAAPASGFSQLGMSEAQFMQLRAGNQSFQQIGGYFFARENLTDQTETLRIPVARVSAGVFESLGIQPALGRSFRQGEDLNGSQEAAVLSYELWQRRFGGNPDILGQTIRLSDNPVIVIGVMPANFRLPEDFSNPDNSQIWLPLRINPANLNLGSYYLQPIARLKPGVQPEQALAEARTVFARLFQDHPESSTSSSAVDVTTRKSPNSLATSKTAIPR